MEILSYPFVQNALAGILLVSIVSAIIGTYIVTRRMTFIAGGITHACFGGLGLGYFLGISPVAMAGVFAVGAVVLVVLFQLRPAWLLSAFNAVLGALALFQPFNGVVGGMFSVSAIVYYLSVIALFLFLTGQSLERRRWH